MITPLLQSGAQIAPAGVVGPSACEGQAGRVNAPAGASSITVQNKLVTVNALVFVQMLSNDSTAAVKNVVTSAGSFTVNFTAATTAETRIGFFIP